MKKHALLFLSFAAVLLSGCNDDDSNGTSSVSIAFANQSVNLINDETPITIAFSNEMPSAGSIILDVTTTDAIYGDDFTTDPQVQSSTISVPFSAGATFATVNFTKLVDAIEGETKNVTFTIATSSISSVEIPAPTRSTMLNFNETALTTNTLVSDNGGNTVPNQVFIDLSSSATTQVSRTLWDLGFSSGNDFRVTINGAINKLAVKQLATTNIDEVQAEDASVTTGNYEASNMAFVDAPYGNLSGTAIAAISANDSENKVYLVNMGNEIAATPATGTSVSLTGANRGWKKVRILRSGNDYKLQYADLNSTTHTEVIIAKNPSYNFTFYSLKNNAIVSSEPEKSKWDLNITTFTSETFYNTGESAGAYFFPDYAVTNTKAGTRAIEVLTSNVTYENFSATNINASNFETNAAADQRAIGGNWRATYPLQLKTDRFYVIKDVAGNYYKLRFTAMLNGQGERGNVTFEYVLL